MSFLCEICYTYFIEASKTFTKFVEKEEKL